jgi:hypothetical protein
VAGGSVASTVHGLYNVTDHSVRRPMPPRHLADDVDIWIRANTLQEALFTIHQIFDLLGDKILCCSLTKNAFTMLIPSETFTDCIYFTESAHTFVKEHPGYVYKVQIILAVLPRTSNVVSDVAFLLNTFDLSCCKLATDGRHLFGSYNAIHNHVCTIQQCSIGPSTVSRILKYWSLGFDFDIRGIPNPVVLASVDGQMITRLIKSDQAYDYSSYETGEPMLNMCKHPLTSMYNRYCLHGYIYPIVFGGRSDVRHTFESGTYTQEYLEDWKLSVLADKAEFIAKSVPDGPSRDVMQHAVIKAVETFCGIMRGVRIEPACGPMHREIFSMEEIYDHWVRPAPPPA